MPPETTTAEFELPNVRADFPILNRPLADGTPLVYLDSAASSQKPRQVLAKLLEVYEQYYSNVHRGGHTLGERVTTELELAREKLQRFIGAALPEEVIFTSGTTASLNLVAHGWCGRHLKAGDEILLNDAEHHANLVPWQEIARKQSAVLKFIPLTSDGRLDLGEYDKLLSPRTKLVAVAGMSNVLGTIHPIAELAARAHRHGALICVDGAQSVPHLPVNVREPAIDFLAFSGHKMFGPTGVGVLYARRDILDVMDPFLTGGNMIRRVERECSTWGDLPARFEAGTPPIAEAIALGAAVDYIEAIGFEALLRHERALTKYAYEKLSEIPGLTILGPTPEHRGGMLTFVIENTAAQDIAEILDRQGIAVRAGHHCTMPLHVALGHTSSTRASFAAYNTLEEADALVAGVKKARRMLM